jgi:hypothetical protein
MTPEAPKRKREVVLAAGAAKGRQTVFVERDRKNRLKEKEEEEKIEVRFVEIKRQLVQAILEDDAYKLIKTFLSDPEWEVYGEGFWEMFKRRAEELYDKAIEKRAAQPRLRRWLNRVVSPAILGKPYSGLELSNVLDPTQFIEANYLKKNLQKQINRLLVLNEEELDVLKKQVVDGYFSAFEQLRGNGRAWAEIILRVPESSSYLLIQLLGMERIIMSQEKTATRADNLRTGESPTQVCVLGTSQSFNIIDFAKDYLAEFLAKNGVLIEELFSESSDVDLDQNLGQDNQTNA